MRKQFIIVALIGLLASMPATAQQTCSQPPTCGAGQASSWNGSSWQCVGMVPSGTLCGAATYARSETEYTNGGGRSGQPVTCNSYVISETVSTLIQCNGQDLNYSGALRNNEQVGCDLSNVWYFHADWVQCPAGYASRALSTLGQYIVTCVKQ